MKNKRETHLIFDHVLLEDGKADREGQYSIRVNDQFQICFVWREGDSHDVESSTTTER